MNNEIQIYKDLSFHKYVEPLIQSNIIDKQKNVKEEILKNIKLKDNNYIFYSINGSGKYSYVLKLLYDISPSKLNYDKKMSIVFNGCDYYLRMSDVHCEIDMSILGCNAKNLWSIMCNQIIDIKDSRKTLKYIVCKNFDKVHPELLDLLYFYLKNINKNNIWCIFITESISFINTDLLDICKSYHICTKMITNKNKRIDIVNRKDIKCIYKKSDKYEEILYKYIVNKSDDFFEIRNSLYNVLIYQLDIHKILFGVVERLIQDKYSPKYVEIIKNFYIYYYNNYRSIYHLEACIVKLIIEYNEL